MRWDDKKGVYDKWKSNPFALDSLKCFASLLPLKYFASLDKSKSTWVHYSKHQKACNRLWNLMCQQKPLVFSGYLLFCQGSLSAKTVKIKVERLANIWIFSGHKEYHSQRFISVFIHNCRLSINTKIYVTAFPNLF